MAYLVRRGPTPTFDILTPTWWWCSNQGGADLDACFCSYPKHPVGTSRRISGRGLILRVGTFASFFSASESRLIYKSTQSWNLILAPAIQ